MSDPDDPQAVIETAAQAHDVDLDEAITAIDPAEESTRIYILDQQAGGDYRLISYGLDADGNAAPTEKPMQIPESSITVVQSLLHGAGMQQSHNAAADADATLRAVSEGVGITEPYLGDQ